MHLTLEAVKNLLFAPLQTQQHQSFIMWLCHCLPFHPGRNYESEHQTDGEKTAGSAVGQRRRPKIQENV